MNDETWFSFLENEEEPFEVIRKRNLHHINMLEKRGKYRDMRISVNIEENVKGKVIYVESNITWIRHKNRTTYHFRSYQLDLTQVQEETKGKRTPPHYEVEIELLDLQTLFTETPRYNDRIVRFMSNLDSISEALSLSGISYLWPSVKDLKDRSYKSLLNEEDMPVIGDYLSQKALEESKEEEMDDDAF